MERAPGAVPPSATEDEAASAPEALPAGPQQLPPVPAVPPADDGGTSPADDNSRQTLDAGFPAAAAAGGEDAAEPVGGSRSPTPGPAEAENPANEAGPAVPARSDGKLQVQVPLVTVEAPDGEEAAAAGEENEARDGEDTVLAPASFENSDAAIGVPPLLSGSHPPDVLVIEPVPPTPVGPAFQDAAGSAGAVEFSDGAHRDNPDASEIQADGPDILQIERDPAPRQTPAADNGVASSQPMVAHDNDDALDDNNGVPNCDFKTWYRKMYLGGYRDKKSHLEFFHAATQTLRPEQVRAMRARPKFHRDTQTKFIRNRFSQGVRNSSTQAATRGVYLSSDRDRQITPKVYVTADEHLAMITKKVVSIQCWVRRIYAMRLARHLREEKARKAAELAEKERRRKELAESKRKKEIESRLHPRSSADFDMLYNGLEHWREQEAEKINNAGYPEAARLAALADLMDQEAALIQKIDHLRRAAFAEARERRIFFQLDQMASPKRWAVKGKGHALVDTPTTIRARELRDLYHALALPLLSIDERLQILLHVKYTVKEFDCSLTREIVDLIDREGDLVSRGRDGRSLEGLRKRVCNLFLRFIMTPEFNPETARYQKYPETGESWRQSEAVYYCQGCTRYLPSTQFYLSTTMHHLGKCKQCTIKENVATERKDGSAYINILQNARIAEQSKRNKQLKAAEDNHEGAPGAAADGSPSKPAAAGKSPAAVQKSEQVARTPIMDLLQESDIRYLVDNIWSSQSAISASRRLEDLHLTRWDSNEDLSPWNCILLTKTEAAAHEAQKDPLSVYGEAFIRKVRQKHLAARVHFAQLRDLSRLWQAKVHQQEEEAAAEVDDDRKSRFPPIAPSHAEERMIHMLRGPTQRHEQQQQQENGRTPTSCYPDSTARTPSRKSEDNRDFLSPIVGHSESPAITST